MDLPVRDDEWLLDEVGDEYRLDADGEREYRVAKPGEDPEYDTWFIEQVEIGLREAADPNAVWITNEEVERQSAERRERYRQMAIERGEL